MMLNKNAFMIETGLDDMSDLSDIQGLIDDKCAVIHKTDKYGRPVFYFRLKLFEPSKYSDEQVRKYLFWVNHELSSRFERHIDTYFTVCDV